MNQTTIILLLSIIFGTPQCVHAVECPLCPAIGAQTIGEEMFSSEIVLMVKLNSIDGLKKSDEAEQNRTAGDDDRMATFDVIQIIKGKSFVRNEQVKAPYYGEREKGSTFYLTGIEPPNIVWNDPIFLDDAAQEYVAGILKLPVDPLDRLKYFQSHLEHKNEVIARDAYDEFARAPYEQILAMKEFMDRKQIVDWAKSEKVPASRRRLYFMLLGVCGTDKEIPMIEEMLRSKNPKKRTGVDAMIACYLTLSREKGLPVIEELFLKPKDAEYTDVYSAVMAIRFHGTDSDVIPRKKLLSMLHHLLDRPRLADLVIPDLARWEDWSVMDRLVKLFEKSEGKTSWVRIPIVNYLKACPLKKAEAEIERLKKIDAEAFKKADIFFPFGDAIDN